jgi:hypothetical protein
LQLCVAPQVPQLPPQPSSPHWREPQLGVQLLLQVPVEVQRSPPVQVPQLPPQPSLPHWRPLQLGVHPFGYWQVPLLHEVPVMHVAHASPPEPQLSVDVPAWQAPSLLQQPEQLAGLH